MIPTNIHLQIRIATVQLEPSPIVEADLRAKADDFARLTRANERAADGKMFIHKAHVVVEKKDGSDGSQGLMQSAMFDSDQGNGRDELRELMDAVKQTVLERFYEPERKLIA